MTVTVEQLLQTSTKDEVLQDLLDQLAALGYSPTSWQSGSVQRTLLEVWAKSGSDFSATQVAIAKSGFNGDAKGDWLTLLSKSVFDNDRQVAVATEGTVTFTCAAGEGPYTIDGSANQMVLADTVNGYLYRTTTGGTLSPGSTLDCTVRADVARAAGDIASNTLTLLKTPLAGVTVNNPTPAGASSWITRNGADEESDPSLRQRNLTKWSTLSVAGLTGMAYEHFALKADAAVTRAWVDDQNPRGAGSLDLIIAGASGAVSPTLVSTVDDYIRGVTDGVGRRQIGDNLLVKSATQKTVVVQATVYMVSSYNTPTNQAAVSDAVRDFFKAVPVGGLRLTPNALGSGVVSFAELFRTVQTQTGVQNTVFASPTADVALAIDEVAVPSLNLTFTSL